jgi:hypothetical protein
MSTYVSLLGNGLVHEAIARSAWGHGGKLQSTGEWEIQNVLKIPLYFVTVKITD